MAFQQVLNIMSSSSATCARNVKAGDNRLEINGQRDVVGKGSFSNGDNRTAEQDIPDIGDVS